MNLVYGPDGTTATDDSHERLVCEQHPDLPWPHGDCGGPGAPAGHRAEVLRGLLREKRIAAQFGDPTAAGWLERHGIDVRSGR